MGENGEIQGGGWVGGEGSLSFIFHLACLCFVDPGCSSALCPSHHRLAQQRRRLAQRGLGRRQESAE